MLHNRSERRLIEQGKGRKKSMIEICDVETLHEYWLSLSGVNTGKEIMYNRNKLFISYHSYEWNDIRSDWLDDDFLCSI